VPHIGCQNAYSGVVAKPAGHHGSYIRVLRTIGYQEQLEVREALVQAGRNRLPQSVVGNIAAQ
jgi:hypothetical protein